MNLNYDEPAKTSVGEVARYGSGGARARHGVDDGRYGGAHDGKHDRGR